MGPLAVLGPVPPFHAGNAKRWTWPTRSPGVLDDAGLTARDVADHLGHERISTTQDDYTERGVVAEDVGPALAECPRSELPEDEG